MKLVPTRDTLIRLKRLKQTVEKGYRLLKKKQQALILELFKEIKGIVKLREKLNKAVEEGYRYLIKGLGEVGILSTYSLVLSMISGYRLEKTKKVIAGAKLIDYTYEKEKEIERSIIPEISPTLTYAQRKFKEALKIILELARKEYKAKIILEELKKVRKRINYLEKIYIPRLEEQIRYISQRLDDFEREEKIRRLKIKK